MYSLGWIKDSKDDRDYVYSASRALPATMPDKVNLRSLMPPIYDQGPLNSCVGNSIARAYQFSLRLQNYVDFTPARLFPYYNAREMEGMADQDGGCMIRDAAKSLNVQGICHESLWPYDVKKVLVKPSPKCYAEGKVDHSVNYSRVAQTELGLQQALVAGHPIVLGIIVYQSMMSEQVAKTGKIPLPSRVDGRPLGGHAITIAGYDKLRKEWLFANSWGTGWGDQGYGYLPWEYLLDRSLASDLWVIQTVVAGNAPTIPSNDWLAENFGWNDK